MFQHEGQEVMSVSGVFRSHAHGLDHMEIHDPSLSENVEHRQYQIPRSIDSSFCTLSGSGDVFGVEVNTDGMTQSLTPLLPASQVGDPSSMKALISLTRTCGESASLTSSHGDFNAGSFQGRTLQPRKHPPRREARQSRGRIVTTSVVKWGQIPATLGWRELHVWEVINRPHQAGGR